MVINLDYEMIESFLTKKGLLDKPLSEFGLGDMNGFIEVIFESLIEPFSGFSPPYETKEHALVIPANAPLKYRWWQGGQSIFETIKEINGSDILRGHYVDRSISKEKS